MKRSKIFGRRRWSFRERITGLHVRLETGAAFLLLISAFSLLPASTNAGWVTRAWQYSDCLPNNTVTDIAQTRDGYLWNANFSQLACFDGAEFQSFPSRPVVPGPDQRTSDTHALPI